MTKTLNKHEKEFIGYISNYGKSNVEKLAEGEHLVGFSAYMPSDGGLIEMSYVGNVRLAPEMEVDYTKGKEMLVSIFDQMKRFGDIAGYAQLYIYQVVNGKFKLVVMAQRDLTNA